MNSNILILDDSSPSLVWDNGEFACNPIAFTFPKSDVKDLVYVKTPDERFHVVYDKTNVYMDVFERTPNDSDNPMWKFDNLTNLFTLRRDDYHNDNFYPIFYKVDDEWRLIFNRRNEGMSVYELPSGKELYRNINPSEFLGHLVELDVPGYKGRFYFAFSWVWGRHETPVVIDMEEVARNGDCRPPCIVGKYQPYIECNYKFNENCLNILYVSKIDNSKGYFKITFELKEGETIDASEFDFSPWKK